MDNADFLVTENVIEVLWQPTKVLDRVPVGEKSNVYVEVNNENNLRRRGKGQKSQFDDDCGAWTIGRSVVAIRTARCLQASFVIFFCVTTFTGQKKNDFRQADICAARAAA